MLATNDVDQPTLAERPEAQFAALLAAASRATTPDLDQGAVRDGDGGARGAVSIVA
jgi:hypothetical protein